MQQSATHTSQTSPLMMCCSLITIFASSPVRNVMKAKPRKGWGMYTSRRVPYFSKCSERSSFRMVAGRRPTNTRLGDSWRPCWVGQGVGESSGRLLHTAGTSAVSAQVRMVTFYVQVCMYIRTYVCMSCIQVMGQCWCQWRIAMWLLLAQWTLSCFRLAPFAMR